MGLRHTQNSSVTLESTPGPMNVVVVGSYGIMLVIVKDTNATVIVQASTNSLVALTAPGQPSTNNWRFSGWLWPRNIAIFHSELHLTWKLTYKKPWICTIQVSARAHVCFPGQQCTRPRRALQHCEQWRLQAAGKRNDQSSLRDVWCQLHSNAWHHGTLFESTGRHWIPSGKWSSTPRTGCGMGSQQREQSCNQNENQSGTVDETTSSGFLQQWSIWSSIDKVWVGHIVCGFHFANSS